MKLIRFYFLAVFIVLLSPACHILTTGEWAALLFYPLYFFIALVFFFIITFKYMKIGNKGSQYVIIKWRYFILLIFLLTFTALFNIVDDGGSFQSNFIQHKLRLDKSSLLVNEGIVLTTLAIYYISLIIFLVRTFGNREEVKSYHKISSLPVAIVKSLLIVIISITSLYFGFYGLKRLVNFKRPIENSNYVYGINRGIYLDNYSSLLKPRYEELINADKESFKVLGYPVTNHNSVAKDKNYVYYGATIIPEADPATFRIEEDFEVDKNNLYYQGKVYKPEFDIDISNFKSLPTPYYYTDSSKVFYFGMDYNNPRKLILVDEAKPNAFKTIIYDYVSDGNNIYCKGQKLEGLKPSDFREYRDLIAFTYFDREKELNNIEISPQNRDRINRTSGDLYKDNLGTIYGNGEIYYSSCYRIDNNKDLILNKIDVESKLKVITDQYPKIFQKK